MSSNHSATLAKPSFGMQAPAKSGAQPSIWRRVFNAWVRSYDSRIDADGKVMIEM